MKRILDHEKNPEINAFYQLCWHLGGSQSDMATLKAEDIDWQTGTISFARKKTATPAIIFLGEETKRLLKTLPTFGHLFPRQAELHEKHRAKLFRRRCQLLGINGISLHSYRYAWAERAKIAGYPERFAQEALGHSSKAVHRAYPNAAALALVPFDRNIGSASAMLGFLQIGVSGLASASVGIFNSHTMMPVALILAVTSWIGFAILLTGKRRIHGFALR